MPSTGINGVVQEAIFCHTPADTSYLSSATFEQVHAMSFLYWACKEPEVVSLLEVAEAACDRARTVVDQGIDWRIIEIYAPDSHLLHETVRLLLQNRLVSAAVVGEPLSPDDLFIAYEWHRKLVVARSELGIIEKIGGRVWRVGEFSHRDLSIFQPIEATESDEPGTFGVKQVSVAEVMRDPAAYYGHLADSEVGGANALFAAGVEAARTRGLSRDQVIVGKPEALGFSIESGTSSVAAWRQRRVISVGAFGFALPNWQEVVGMFEEFDRQHVDHDRLAAQVEQWRVQGLSFGLAVLLRGLEDPPVVIPMGSVYQQPTMGSFSQNLATAQAHQVTVGAGASVPLVLPAWCLNPTFSSPHGPMIATPLVASGVGGSQSDVWAGIRRRYGGKP